MRIPALGHGDGTVGRQRCEDHVVAPEAGAEVGVGAEGVERSEEEEGEDEGTTSAVLASDVEDGLAGAVHSSRLLVVILTEEPSHEVIRMAQVAGEEIQVRYASVGAAMHHLQTHLPERHPLRARVDGPSARAEGEAAASQPERVDFGRHPFSRHVDAHEIRIRASAPHPLGISFHEEEHLRWARLEGHMNEDVDARLH